MCLGVLSTSDTSPSSPVSDRWWLVCVGACPVAHAGACMDMHFLSKGFRSKADINACRALAGARTYVHKSIVENKLYLDQADFPLRDVGNAKSRGWRKLKRDTQVAQAVTTCLCWRKHEASAALSLYSTVQYSAIPYVQYSAIPYRTVKYSTVQDSTLQYSAAQYSTVFIVL